MSEDDQEADPATQAFEELRAEVTLMRRAVERLTAERMEIPETPDYSETLGVIASNVTAVARRVDKLAKSPMLDMTPEAMSERISRAASTAREEDRKIITTARTGLEDATRQIPLYIGSARTGMEQKRHVGIAAAGGLVAGMLVWAVCAGIIARGVPASWQWPERMAARTLDKPMWDGGVHMMQTASPQTFATVIWGQRIVEANRKAIDACQKRADKAREAVQCTIEVRPGARR